MCTCRHTIATKLDNIPGMSFRVSHTVKRIVANLIGNITTISIRTAYAEKRIPSEK